MDNMGTFGPVLKINNTCDPIIREVIYLLGAKISEKNGQVDTPKKSISKKAESMKCVNSQKLRMGQKSELSISKKKRTLGV